MPKGSPPCRVCGRPSRPRSPHALCRDCAPSHCYTCGGPKPAARHDPQCAGCASARAKRKRETATRCTDCWEPLAGQTRCRRCNSSRYQDFKQVHTARQRACRACGKPMPLGRTKLDCTDCYRERQKQIFLTRPHACPWCRRDMTGQPTRYCRPCSQAKDRQQRRRDQFKEAA